MILTITKKRGFRQSWVIKIRVSGYNDDMPFLPDLLTKIKTLGAALAVFVTGLPEKFSVLCAAIRKKGMFSGKLFPGTRKWPLIGLGAALVLLLALICALLVINRGPRAGPPSAGELAGPVQKIRIPPEELFLPEEPDFLPGVLLERERRGVWTAEDAAPYWQDPLKHGEEPWREQVELAIDELLERVP
jgi:hypothetical protein